MSMVESLELGQWEGAWGHLAALTLVAVSVSRVGWGRKPSLSQDAWGLAEGWEGLCWGSDHTVLCVEGGLLSPTTSAVTINCREI